MKAHDVFGPQGLWETPQQGDFLLLEFGDNVICVETQIAEITWNGDLILEGDETLAEVLKTCGLSEADLPSTSPFYQVDPGPEQELLRKERNQALNQAVMALPPKIKNIFLDRMNGETLDAIGRKYNFSGPHVRLLVAKAEKMLGYEMSKRGLSHEKPYTHGIKKIKNYDTLARKKFEPDMLPEAEYHGRTVKLGKPFLTPDGPKKRSVYVKNPKSGNVIKVNFGDKKMKIKKSDPARRRSFRARHKCHTAKDRTKARYWSCKFW